MMKMDDDKLNDRKVKKPGKSLGVKNISVRIILAIYIVCVLGFTYWYWMRPVRAEQVTEAQEKWRGYAEVFDIPIPTDERYGW